MSLGRDRGGRAVDPRDVDPTDMAQAQDEHAADLRYITNGRRHKFYRARLGTGTYEGEEIRDLVNPDYVIEDNANLISSELRGGLDEHTIALDVDFPVAVVPSSTPGHFHLYIDKVLDWDDYVKLLDVLADIGLLEPGYVAASKRRKGTHLRLPWVRKSNEQSGEPNSPVAGSTLR